MDIVVDEVYVQSESTSMQNEEEKEEPVGGFILQEDKHVSRL